MTPDARVQEAVEAAHKWGMQAPTPLEIEVFARLDAGETEQQYGLDELEGAYACGLLASTPETERLRSALQRADDAIAMLIPEVQQTYSRDQIKADARAVRAEIQSLLTPTQPQ